MQINTETIKKDFPQLRDPNNHYLDNAATSLTPQVVLDAVVDYYTNTRANVHRGLFPAAVRATERYEEARTKVAKFIGANSGEIIFTSGATESSNMLVRMLEASLNFDNKNIVTSAMEHHGAFLPLQQFAARKNLTLLTIPLLDVALDYEKTEELITEHTAIVSVMLASNVIGEINDIRRIAELAHKHGALMLVDATAAAGHIPVDVEALGADALYFSAHKMLGTTGVGILFAKKALLEKLQPATFGGHMVERFEGDVPEWAPIPSRFEAGTKDIGGVIALGAAVDYLEKIGVENIHAHTQELVSYAIGILETIDGVKVFAEHDPLKNVGIVSFSCDFAHPHDVAEILARDAVAVRPGHHCAIPLHDALGVAATLRASFHCYNDKQDIDALIEAVLKAKDIFSQE